MKKLLLSVVLILVNFVTLGQTITALDSSDCAPFTVDFNSNALGPGNWDFGDGSSAINQSTPQHVYSNPGTYTATFNGTESITIEVFANPTADFTTPDNSDCVPFNATFNSTSTALNGANIVKWEWTTGDGGSATGENANYTYTITGSYDVILKVTDDKGCIATENKPKFITVLDPPVPNFTTNPTASCTSPVTVTTTNLSTNNSGGTTGLTYAWDFGNGQTSTQTNPSVTYNAQGNYTITLDVTEDGCTKTFTRNFTVGEPTAIISGPDTVCLSLPFTFVNGSQGATSYLWEVDGSSIGTATNPTHAFATGGDHSVKLTATSGQGCAHDTTVNIYVQEVIADYTRNPTYFCDNNNPYCVNFTDASTTNAGTITTYNWTYGDGFTGTGSSGSHCYYTDTNIYTVHDPWYFTTTLNVITSSGCQSTIQKTDTVYPISAFFSPDSSEGCAPLTVTFSDSTRSRENIVKWTYDFGDGNTSTSQNPQHTYTNPGMYIVTLIAENSIGCIDTSFEVIIQVGEQLNLDFSISNNNVCLGDTVTFTNTSTDPDIDSVDYWHFQTDNNLSSHNCMTDSIQSWAYFNDVGQHDVTMLANFNGCITEHRQANAVTVNGPSSKFFYNGNCATPNDWNFDANVQGATSWTWDYGDGNTLTSSNLNDTAVSHTYAATGDYTVTLISENNGNACPNDTDSMVVHVRNINASLSGDSVICSGLTYTFNAASSTDVHSSCGNGYHWDLGPKTPNTVTGDTLMTFNFNQPTKDTIRLIVKDINHCKDTLEYPIRSTTITAQIGADTLQGCIPITVNFSDSTKSDTTVVQWQWYETHQTDYSWVQIGNTKDITHVFGSSTSFPDTVILVVRDSLGCSDSDSVVVTPIIPDSIFTAGPDLTICRGDSVTFFPNDMGGLQSWNWDIGLGMASSTQQTPKIEFDTVGLFDARLTVVDTNGCTASYTRTNYVNVQGYPDVGFVALNEDGQNLDTLPVVCYGQQIDFTDTSVASIFWRRTWDLATGSPVIGNQTVSWIYDAPGTYDVSLTVITTFGCTDSIKKSLTFVGPVGDFDISDSIICLGQEVTFTMKDTADVFNYKWDFGDGVTDSINSPATHQYNNVPLGGKTLVQLILQAPISNGISCSYVAEDTLYVYQVEAGFSLTDSIFCDGEEVMATDTSLGGEAWIWNFGNGTTFNVQQPTTGVTYTPGTYTITQIVSNTTSPCVDTATTTIEVMPLPNVSVTDAAFCTGGSATLTASGANTYSWSPASILSATSGTSVTASPTETSTITVIGTDTNNCSTTTTATVAVMQSVPTSQIDTCIVIGQPYTIGQPDLSPLYTYDWTKGETKWLNCTNCSNNYLHVTQEEDDTLKYTLIFTDSLGCYQNQAIYNICINPSYTFDVPTAFTPDGDNVNDIAYVEGHGIKRLIYFKIYNRWGEVVFETNDINQGWDGTYKGERQSIESFVYKAAVEYYNGQEDSKAGTITILR